MNCEEALELQSERLAAGLPDGEEQRLQAHLAGCPACRTEADAMTAMWSDMGALDALPRGGIPHERMRARLHSAIAVYEYRRQSLDLSALLRRCLPQSVPQLAFALMLLTAGIFVGQLGQPDSNAGGAALRREVQGVGLVLLDHQSAAERLRGVGWTQRTDAVPQVVDALLETVRHDESVNVRLAALDALSQHLHSHRVVDGLTAALVDQHAPLMQVSLARVLLASGAVESVGAVQRMAESETLDPQVRDQLNAALQEYESPGTSQGV